MGEDFQNSDYQERGIPNCRDKEEADVREQARRKAVVADRAKETQAAIAEQIREKAAMQKAAAEQARREADETARKVQVQLYLVIATLLKRSFGS